MIVITKLKMAAEMITWRQWDVRRHQYKYSANSEVSVFDGCNNIHATSGFEHSRGFEERHAVAELVENLGR